MKKITFIVVYLSLITVIFLPTSEALAKKNIAPESNNFDSGDRERIRLSPQEKTFLKNHPVIQVSNDLGYPPFDFAIEGEPHCSTIDLLKLLAKKIGQGAHFCFELPVDVLSGEQTESIRPGQVVGLADGEPEYRLLVAEDHSDSRTLLAALLRSVVFAVREAANGREALEIWRQWQPQLIWMDIRMPQMDGLSAIRKIRELPGGEQTIIIGLTAFAFEEDKQKVMTTGDDDFVRKPWTEEMIFSSLEKHLGVCFQYDKDEPLTSDKTRPDRLEPTEFLPYWRIFPRRRSPVFMKRSGSLMSPRLSRELKISARALRGWGIFSKNLPQTLPMKRLPNTWIT